MNLNSVYTYECPRQFLLDTFSTRKSQDEVFSIRKWSKEMGLKSHSLLTQMLQGKKKIKLRHVDILNSGINLNSQEKLFFQHLIQYSNADSIEEKELVSNYLSEINPGGDFTTKDVDDYRLISDWSYASILSVLDLSDFDGSIEDIHNRLKSKLTLADIKSKINRLKALGLVSGEDKLKATYKKTTTKDDVANEGVKEYHKQVAQLGIEAVDEVDLINREFQSYAVSLNSKNIHKFKSLIRNFIASVDVESNNGPTDQVYQLNVQFFQLTESPISTKDISDCDVVSCNIEGDLDEKF
jgi:uncharacterized protein (TIGR02147 family)